jgi:hypothetical protein
MAVMEHRRAWTVAIGSGTRTVEVVYAALFGWMSIEVDGVRQARAWREWQTVVGGASLSVEADGHRLQARVTQPFGRQEYAFSLRLDGELLPGSDPQPEPRRLTRETRVAILRIVIAAAATGIVAGMAAAGAWQVAVLGIVAAIALGWLLERVV